MTTLNIPAHMVTKKKLPLGNSDIRVCNTHAYCLSSEKEYFTTWENKHDDSITCVGIILCYQNFFY